ncbi:hypothetical protein ACFQPG_10705 [Sphingomonas sp. GCM10030256]|uniref:hypothetical protein n=1 Tax=Sphingomonas sp. GCM10030256 TaxID=3273427 RepID=UPI0036136626
MTDAAKVREARARGEADAAKARLMGTMDELKARLAPGKLTSDAVQAAKDKGITVADNTVTAVKDKPVMAAGVATAAALFLARKPLFAAVGRWFRGEDDQDDTTTTRRRSALEPEELE